MITIAIYSNKGGVGKTATAVNLAYTAAVSGNSVLLCDMDSQGAASYYFRVRPSKKFSGKKFLKGDVHAYIRGTDYENLDLLPAHFTFRNFDIILNKKEKKKNSSPLEQVFDTVADQYDMVLLDCPPNPTLLSEHILRAVDVLVVPVIPTTLSILALQQLLKLAKKLKIDRRKIQAFFSMVEKRKSLHASTMKQYGKYPIFINAGIPYSAEVEKMGVVRQPVGAGSSASAIALMYEQLWREIWRRSEKS